MLLQNYCQHFQSLTITKTIDIPRQPKCRQCDKNKNYLWICLYNKCGQTFCDEKMKQHLKVHIKQNKSKNEEHGIFMNLLTAQIICVHCNIEVQVNDVSKAKKSDFPDLYPLRLKILPQLASFNELKQKGVLGQLENSEGHRNLFRSLTGLFTNRNNHAINSALQFLMQFDLFKQTTLNIKTVNKETKQLVNLFKQLQSAEKRVVSSNNLTQYLFNKKPQLLGYQRKDPFQHVFYYLNQVHQAVKSIKASSKQQNLDEWELQSMNQKNLNNLTIDCPIFNNTDICLVTKNICPNCKSVDKQTKNLNILKLNIPRQRASKDVQRQLASHKFKSPGKKRGSSLKSLFVQQKIPIALPELVINYLKNSLMRDTKLCSPCGLEMKKQKMKFQALPNYLIIHINRMGADRNSIDDTLIDFDLEPIDFGSFCSSKQKCIYQFEAAIIMQNSCSFPVVTKNKVNHQTYIIKHEMVQLLKQNKTKLNPYLICYKKQLPESDLTRMYHNIKSNVECCENDPRIVGVPLPDFWLGQLKHKIVSPLVNNRVCKHGRYQPGTPIKMEKQQKVPQQVFQYLLQHFEGDNLIQEKCDECQKDIKLIRQRKQMEKKKIAEYDSIKSSYYCMINASWLEKWSLFLYKKSDNQQVSKGNPMPGRIDNTILMQDGQLKPGIRINQDFKVVNVFTWKFLKQLYGGGPQIRYKWGPSVMTEIEQQGLKRAKTQAQTILKLYHLSYMDSNKENMKVQTEDTTSMTIKSD